MGASVSRRGAGRDVERVDREDPVALVGPGVGLHLFDELHRLVGDPGDAHGAGVRVHREHRVLVGVAAVGVHELTHEVVERRAKVERAVAEHERPPVVEIGHVDGAVAVAHTVGVHLVHERERGGCRSPVATGLERVAGAPRRAAPWRAAPRVTACRRPRSVIARLGYRAVHDGILALRGRPLRARTTCSRRRARCASGSTSPGRCRGRSCSTASGSRSRRRPVATRRGGVGWSSTIPTSARGRRALPQAREPVPRRLPRGRARRDATPCSTPREYLTEHLHEVPVFVIPCILGRLPGQPSNEEGAGFYGSILPAVWNFQLALAQPRTRLGVHDAAPGVRGRRRASCSASPRRSRRPR